MVAVAVMDQELKQALVDLESRIEHRLDALATTFNERLEATETKLLTAFHNWAQTFETRTQSR